MACCGRCISEVSALRTLQVPVEGTLGRALQDKAVSVIVLTGLYDVGEQIQPYLRIACESQGRTRCSGQRPAAALAPAPAPALLFKSAAIQFPRMHHIVSTPSLPAGLWRLFRIAV